MNEREYGQKHSNKESASLVPLCYFDSDVEFLKIDKNIVLRRMREDELPTEVVEHWPFDEFANLEISQAKYVLEGRLLNFLQHTNRIVLAMRLLKTGDVTANLAYTLHPGGGSRVVSNDLSFPFSKNIYFLRKEETPSLLGILEKVKDLASKPFVEFPLATFTEAYRKRKPEDRLIDCTVALESVVFHEEDKAIEPAGRVIGIAIGLFIGRNQEEREKIKKRMIEVYDIRNVKVHGNVQKLKKLKTEHVERCYVEVEDCLRRTLRRLVEE